MAKVTVVGDSLVSSDALQEAALSLDIEQPITIAKYE